jgi:hypothetical protein
VQQYISEAKGQDIRCFVVGEKVIATMQRTAQDGEFRANIHLGASGKEIKITPYEEEMAIKASKAAGLGDPISDERLGYLVITEKINYNNVLLCGLHATFKGNEHKGLKCLLE